jgi:hypothetical protein
LCEALDLPQSELRKGAGLSSATASRIFNAIKTEDFPKYLQDRTRRKLSKWVERKAAVLARRQEKRATCTSDAGTSAGAEETTGVYGRKEPNLRERIEGNQHVLRSKEQPKRMTHDEWVAQEIKKREEKQREYLKKAEAEAEVATHDADVSAYEQQLALQLELPLPDTTAEMWGEIGELHVEVDNLKRTVSELSRTLLSVQRVLLERA